MGLVVISQIVGLFLLFHKIRREIFVIDPIIEQFLRMKDGKVKTGHIHLFPLAFGQEDQDLWLKIDFQSK